MDGELLIQCARCQTQTRVPISAVALATRACPKCGAGVTPVRIGGISPTPAASQQGGAHLPTSSPLADLAGFEPSDDIPVFDLKPEPPAAKNHTPVVAEGDGDMIRLRDEELPPSQAESFQADLPAKAPPERNKRVRIKATLGKKSVAEAVYGFPFRFENLRVLVLLLFTIALIAGSLCGMRALWDLFGAEDSAHEVTGLKSLMYRAAIHVFIGLAVFTAFPSLFLAATFLRTIEETSAGIDDIPWPKDSWFEYLGKWLFLVWIFAVAGGIGAIMLIPIMGLVPGWLYAIGIVILGWLLFPIVLLSIMAGNAPWMIVYPPLLLQMLKKPAQVGFLYANAFPVLLVCGLLGYLVIGKLLLFLLPVAVPIWTMSLLCYGRVLGRVGFELTRE
jgi:hypothetical protein